MESPSQLASTYQHMSEGALLEIANEGGLTPEAKQAIAEELHRRKLKTSDLAQVKESPHERLEKEAQERWFPLARGHSLGFGLYGRKYLSESDREENIQAKTKFFVFVIPLIPIASYRFRCSAAGNKWYSSKANKWFQLNIEQKPLSQEPLDWSQVFKTWLTSLLWIGGAMAAIILYGRFK
jgi:hypothetical protein